MSTEQDIKDKYHGAPLLSIEQLAEILLRSKDGLRLSLCGDNEVSRKFLPCKLKIGRRVYFRTSEVAKALDQD
ncbi:MULTISPECIES: plasmid-related protein [Pseudomonas]|uniref:plasmid-related protein n=1 Tax=Pseudomonas TaxID=286 RepID=UPI000CFDB197|nr:MULTISPECIES: plasmid-related protein [Pseudomonas]PQZ85739.1 plasmid-related protein [Pseudomonas trivialis]PRB21980.1 plasmid-related protein [Pseudomonas sp. MYb60]